MNRLLELWIIAALAVSVLPGKAHAEWMIEKFAGFYDERENAPAARIYLNGPRGMAVDGEGNIFIADTNNHRVRKVSSAGLVTTVAGIGIPGFTGDGGPAQQACLYRPSAVSIGPDGAVYIADTYNHRIRKVDGSGTITTIAGSGPLGSEQISGGQLGDGGPATSALLRYPSGVVIGANGDVFIADEYHRKVRKVIADGTIVSVARFAFLQDPYGIAADTSGNVYVSDYNWRLKVGRILKIPPKGMASVVIRRRGLILSGISVDPGGAIYGAATNENYIYKIDQSRKVTTLATEALLKLPYGVAIDSAGDLLIADTSNNLIRRVDVGGIINTVCGDGSGKGFSGDGGPATNARLANPGGISAGENGSIFIADTGNGRIRKVSASGIISTIAGGGTNSSSFNLTPLSTSIGPVDVTADGAGNYYIADKYGFIWKMNSDNASVIAGNFERTYFRGDGFPAYDYVLESPTGVAVDSARNVYVAESGDNRIRKISKFMITSTISTLMLTTIAGGNGQGYSGDGGPATRACLNHPFGIALDGMGNIYFSDRWNNCVRKIDAAGTITTVAGIPTPGIGTPDDGGFSGDGGLATQALLNSPSGIAFDSNGKLYIVDRYNNRIRMVDTDGIITTIAGRGFPGLAGDGGPAALALFAFPTGIAIDSDDVLYITDNGLSHFLFMSDQGYIELNQSNHLVRRIYKSTDDPEHEAALSDSKPAGNENWTKLPVQPRLHYRNEF